MVGRAPCYVLPKSLFSAWVGRLWAEQIGTAVRKEEAHFVIADVIKGGLFQIDHQKPLATAQSLFKDVSGRINGYCVSRKG